MSKLSMLASASVLSIVVAGSVVSPAFAWHPKGMITKSVQNLTAGGALQAADSTSTAISAKPGDVLNYTIEVKNIAAPADKQYNDLAFTVVTDTLPAGVELVSNPSNRALTENMGTILPGKSRTVTYQVKVTTATNGAIVTNKACFTADSVVKDNPQKGCDDAVVKVNVPPTPVVVTPVEETKTPVTPTAPTPVTPAATQPAALPNVGAGSTALYAFMIASILGTLGHKQFMKRRMA